MVMPKLVDHDEQRRAIAEAAVAVISAHGLDATRLRDVAEEADVTTGAVTHYFDGKDAVLEAALDEIVARIVEKQESLRDRQPARSADELAAHAAEFLPIDAQARAEWRVWCAFWGRSIVNETLRRKHEAHYDRFGTVLAEMVRALAKAGVIAPQTDARMTADAIIAAVDGVGIRVTQEPALWPPARQKALLNTLLLPLFTGGEAAKPRRR